MNHHPTIIRRLGAACALGLLLGSTAYAADPPSKDARARYEQERARCMSGTSGQAQETCLREAGAALDVSRSGGLDDKDAKYRKNAKDRCDSLQGDEKRDCMARVKDAPNTTESGSVKGGGVLKESKTIEVGPAVVVQPAPAPAK